MSFSFKQGQSAISEQCKWVLSIHSSVICHKSQGLREDFEMLIRMSAVTSLCTFKNTADLSFMCAWKFLKVLPLSEMSKINMKFCHAPAALKSQGRRSERRFKITTLLNLSNKSGQNHPAAQPKLKTKSREILCETQQTLDVSKSTISFIKKTLHRPRKLDSPHHNYTWL